MTTMPKYYSECDYMETKKISVSNKRQITIPATYYEKLGIEKEVECLLVEDQIIIRPVRKSGGEFATEILKDLVENGYDGEELIKKFIEMNKRVRPAIVNMIAETDERAKNLKGTGDEKTAELFGEED